jgi:4-hydroxybenzoate polyprenyltransferase
MSPDDLAARRPGWLTRLRAWAEMVKFEHSVFALPFALLATFLAGRGRPAGWPALGQVLLIILCMVAARSFAMTFNRIADRRIDADNPRTAARHLITGRISLPAAWTMLLLAAAAFIGGCAGFLVYGNGWPMALSLPVLVYLAVYSYTKHFTVLAHFWLGSAIAFSPVAAWIAIDPGSLGWPAVLLLIVVTTWIGGFDIIYACQDVAFDRGRGLLSIPARLGVGPALWVARGCHLVTIAGLVGLAPLANLGMLYAIGVAMVALLLVGENALVRPNDLSRVNLAFFAINGVVSVILGILGIADIVLEQATNT